MKMTPIFEDRDSGSGLVIYKRNRGSETSTPLYAEYRGEEHIMDFRTKSQVVARLKKLGLLKGGR